MRYGLVMPYPDIRAVPRLAAAAESAGWDGFFLWESLYGIDAWMGLTAAAMRTSRLRLGTMLTPPSRMRPWKLASETVTLDLLSEGRAQLAVGLGAPDTGWAEFGEVTDRRTRAELLDESLDIVTGLWRGDPSFSYEGKHYRIRPNPFPVLPPPPVQQPRIPIWVVGLWESRRSMARVAKYDGILPATRDDSGVGPELVAEIATWARTSRAADTPFDIVTEGETYGLSTADAADRVRPLAEAGATWWIEGMWSAVDGSEESRARLDERVAQGPPTA